MINKIKFIDLFCGIGGFRIALEQAAKKSGIESQCVFSSDIDPYCQQSYFSNFGEQPVGDITKVCAQDIPNHDILLAGFPCQAFSIMGEMKGFDDTRGTLFFDIARIIKEKKPAYFILENVKQLQGHDKGQTLKVILKTLRELGYDTTYKVLNALDFGLPQKRERIWIVGALHGLESFSFPIGNKTFTPLENILVAEDEVPENFLASDHIREKRKAAFKGKIEQGVATIWHENKSGNISAYPYSCALRAGASHNYLLVNGERRLVPRELLRLQGFPDSYKITVSDAQIRKQAGNSLPINTAKAVINSLFESMEFNNDDTKTTISREIQTTLPIKQVS